MSRWQASFDWHAIVVAAVVDGGNGRDVVGVGGLEADESMFDPGVRLSICLRKH